MQKQSRFFTILHLCSYLLLTYSFSMLLPVAVGVSFNETNLTAFLLTFLVAFSVGILGWHLTKGREKNLQTREGFLVAVLFWLIFTAASAIPFLLDARIHLSLEDAVFEAVSGVTTTGGTIFSDVDALPKSILYYRAQLNFIGGLGIIVLAVAIMPFLGIGGAKLYQSEMPGPMREEKFTPRLKDTAKHLWTVYSGATVLCALSYWFAGMSGFDAVCHAMSTLSLGGFSTHTASIGHYNSYTIELLAGFFTLVAALNFALYFVAIRKRNLKVITANPEVRFFFVVAFLVVAFCVFELWRTDTFGVVAALVHGFFLAVSILTDNGLTSGGYPAWPMHIVLLLLAASFFGGCVGSTAGGLKSMRVLLMCRQTGLEISQLALPNAVLAVKVGGHVVSERVIRSVWALFFLFLVTTVAATWIMMAMGYDFMTAFGSVAAGLNNMGVGAGDTASHFGGLNSACKWMLSLLMLLGRLEIFPIVIMLSRSFWRF